ncbi:MAG: rRNA pseudouridine synthase [Armatimonadetes bacterium]|nr:rRNA pseudouridine synthase [Armatimonadota bacterium]
MEERLQKVLAAAGVASRRKSEELITAGRVTVNGKIVNTLGARVDPDSDEIKVEGRLVVIPHRKYYILLNKPAGYTSTRFDRFAKKTVMELVADMSASLHTVGRLDVDTEGLIILTNDGDLTYKLTHPSHEVGKTYVATVRGVVTDEDLKRLREGVDLEDGVTAPAEAKLLETSADGRRSVVELTIHEGRKRQVRRMLAAVGHKVERLVRTKIDGIEAGDLPVGAWRHLTAEEIKRLKEAAGQN